MTQQSTNTLLDQATADRLSVAFHRCFSHYEAADVHDARITAVTTYCNGGWDAELRARHAAN